MKPDIIKIIKIINSVIANNNGELLEENRDSTYDYSTEFIIDLSNRQVTEQLRLQLEQELPEFKIVVNKNYIEGETQNGRIFEIYVLGRETIFIGVQFGTKF